MSRVFADSFYFFAILNPRDRVHQKDRPLRRSAG
jgi:hypothetical protein